MSFLRKTRIGCAVVALALVVGCSNSPQESAPEEPVHLTVFQQAGISQEQFETLFARPTASKYPHITLELLPRTEQNTLGNMLTAGNFPDIVLAGYLYASTLKQMNALANLDAYVEKYRLDLDRYEQEPIQTIIQINGGSLPGLPYALNFAVNYYNKDIFDRFGVPYPQDGMTWAQTVELSRLLTRQDGGVNYRGLIPGNIPERVAVATGVGYADPSTNKATLNNDGWRQVFNLFVTVYQIPEYSNGTNGRDAFSKGKAAFLQEKNVAMFADWGDLMTDFGVMYSRGEDFNWDMVTLPNFEEHLGKGRNSGAHTLFISDIGQHKEQAFLAVSHITDDQVQDMVNRSGKLPSLKVNEEMKRQFGSDLPYLKGKNVNAIFDVTFSELPPVTDFDPGIKNLVNNLNFMQSITESGKDLNTALRELEESANRFIEQQLAK